MTLHLDLRKRALEMDPYTPLLVAVFGASIVLFAICFATESIYFLEGHIVEPEKPSSFLTFGLFAICLNFNGETGKTCTDPRIGYQLDALQSFSETINGFTAATYLPALGGLPLHLASFVLSILAMGIIIVSCHRRNFFSRWIFEIVSFVAGFVLVTYFLDIGLYFSLSGKITTQTLFIGNGTWLTLVAFLMTSSSGILFKIHTNYISQSRPPPPLPRKDRLRDLEEGENTITQSVFTTESQPSKSDVGKTDIKPEGQYNTAPPNIVSQADWLTEHSRTASSGSRVSTSTAQPLTQLPTSESRPVPPLPEEVINEDAVETPSLYVPSMAWNGLRESTSSRGGIPSSHILPDSEPDELLSTRASSRYFRDQQSAYAPSSYHTYHRESSSSSSVRTGTGMDGGVSVSDDDQVQIFPSRASSCLNSPVATRGKTPRSEYRVSNKDLSRSASITSNATSKRSYNRMTPQPSPLAKSIPSMPTVQNAQPLHKQPTRPRIDTSLLQVYPPLITAFANDSFTSLVTNNSAIPSESASSTPVSPIRPTPTINYS